MLSIGITVCDNDYNLLDQLLMQIKEKVKVPYEIIIIDNRDKFKDDKKSWAPTFQFGYNAYQFAARAKIIEFAKGDYIWFVDGDDDIGEVTDFSFNEDIIVFSYNAYPDGNYIFDEKIITENILTEGIISEIKPVLWNKFIKKDLFSNEFISKNKNKAIVHTEDTLWLYEALLHTKSIREVSSLIYYHKEGISNRVGNITLNELKTLVTGFDEAKTIINNIFDEEIASRILFASYTYLGRFISKIENIEEATKLIMRLIPKKDFRNILQDVVYPRCLNKKQVQTIINIVKRTYGDDFPFKEKTCYVTYPDGHKEEYKFIQKIDFDEMADSYTNKNWHHGISIICLVYDGNKQFLLEFTSNIEKYVKVNHEIIIVDNRNDKTEELIFYGNAKVIKTDNNVGILEGRRIGFEASTQDYIWFVDIDDIILPVKNIDYGDNDVLVFPFRCNGIHTCGEKKIIPETDFFNTDTMWLVQVYVWNKWFKRDVLEQAYKDIPHFFCVYHEDNILSFTAIKYSKYIEIEDSQPIYSHIVNDSSTTTKKLKTKESVDLIFAGFKKATDYMKSNFQLCKNLSEESPYNVIFYLKIMNKADDCILDYFAKKMISLFGINMIKDSINIVEKNDGITLKRIQHYFK